MRMPSLNALHAFEAAARHQSFVRAAAELHVTQGAISRHVKLLEAELGAVLFRRQSRGVELTAKGRALLPELTASFERIARAARQIGDSDRELRIACPPTLGVRWLMPRIPRFQELMPTTRLTTTLFCTHEEFARGGFDIGIIDYEQHLRRPANLEGVLLREEALTPICAPALLQGSEPLREPADLARHILLHPSQDRRDWRKWLRHAGLPEALADGGQVFHTLDMTAAAAAGGLGVAIADRNFIGDDLATGRLVAPFDLVVTEETGYFLFTEKGRFAEPKIARFRDWLLAEVAAENANQRPASRAKAGRG
jgi:LysR family glycine cleavage system transcriptional activator